VLFVWLFGVLVVFLWAQTWGEELVRLRPLGAASCLGVRDGATVRQWVVGGTGLVLLLSPWCGFLGVILVGCAVVVLNESGRNKVNKRRTCG